MDRPAANDAVATSSPSPQPEDPPALTPSEFAALSRLAARLPARWIATPRRRRFLFLALAAPGFLAVFATPLHGQLLLTVLGFALFGAAVLFRVLTEPLFVRADAAELWPSRPSSISGLKDSHHA